MQLTRRDFCARSVALAAASALIPAGLSLTGWIGSAEAAEKNPSMVELMAPQALPDMALGPKTAPVTIIEYASMTCPHCAHFATTTFPELKKRYIDTGKVHFIFREFPLDPLAAGASMLARCSADKASGDNASERYFALVEALFAGQLKWAVQKPLPPLFDVAKQAGFTKESFDACLSNQALLDKIEKMRGRAADEYGVNSTPTFFINGKVERGALTIEDMAKAIDPYLKSK